MAQDDVTLSMARERFKEGVAYFDKKDFAKARVAFLQAYALKKHPAVLLNLAQSELRSGHEADAAQHFAQYLREHKDASDSERQSAETGLTAAKALVGELALDVDPPGAEVYLDAESVGTAPLPGSLYVAPGSHRLQVKKEGKSNASDVSVAAGQTAKLSLKLASSAASAPPPAPVAAEPSPPAAAESEPEPVPEKPQSRKSFTRWLASTPGAMVGVGITGVGVLGGGAFAFGSKAAYDAADSVAAQIGDKAVVDGKPDRTGACLDPESWLAKTQTYGGNSAEQIASRQDRASQYQRNCDKYQNNVKSGDRFKTLAIVSFAVAGVAAFGTMVYYVVDSKEPAQARRASERRFAVLPIYQPGFAGGLITGSF